MHLLSTHTCSRMTSFCLIFCFPRGADAAAVVKLKNLIMLVFLPVPSSHFGPSLQKDAVDFFLEGDSALMHPLNSLAGVVKKLIVLKNMYKSLNE